MSDQIVVQETPPQDPPGGGAPQPVTGAERTFTQAELNAIIDDRLKRERGKYADYADLKARADKLAEIETAQMGELEKAQARAAALEAERDRVQQHAQDTLLRAAFIAAAAIAGAAHPEDAFALADRGSISIGDDGKVVGVDDAVKALVEAGRIPMSGRPPAPSLDGGAGSGKPPGDKISLTAEEIEMCRKMRITPEQYAESKRILQGGK